MKKLLLFLTGIAALFLATGANAEQFTSEEVITGTKKSNIHVTSYQVSQQLLGF